MYGRHIRGLCCSFTVLCAALGACEPVVSGPSGPPTVPIKCGDDRSRGDEVCDGEDLNEQSCESLGFGPGALGCKLGCTDYDRSACGAPQGCGDGVRRGVEICDQLDVAGLSCSALGLGVGELGCLPNCGELDLSDCGPPLDASAPDHHSPVDATGDGGNAQDRTPMDVAPPDSNRPDRWTADAGRPDGHGPDGNLADGALPDGALPDGARPDGARPDGARPDAYTPDSGTCPPGHIPAGGGCCPEWQCAPTCTRDQDCPSGECHTYLRRCVPPGQLDQCATCSSSEACGLPGDGCENMYAGDLFLETVCMRACQVNTDCRRGYRCLESGLCYPTAGAYRPHTCAAFDDMFAHTACSATGGPDVCGVANFEDGTCLVLTGECVVGCDSIDDCPSGASCVSYSLAAFCVPD